MRDEPLTGRAAAEALGALMRLGASGQRFNARKLDFALRSRRLRLRLRYKLLTAWRQLDRRVLVTRRTPGAAYGIAGRQLAVARAAPDRPRPGNAA